MHESVREYVAQQRTTRVKIGKPLAHIVEFGSQDLNGGVRDLFDSPLTRSYVGIDIVAGPGVDVVYDGYSIHPSLWETADMAICTNVFEHVEDPVPILQCMYKALKPDGVAVIQAAGPNFTPHSGRSASLILEPGEFYRNVGQWHLEKWLEDSGFTQHLVWLRKEWPFDIYAVAEK